MLQRALAIGSAALAVVMAGSAVMMQGGLAAAQGGTGTASGRVVWCGTSVGPLTITPSGPVPQPAEPGVDQSTPAPDVQPAPPTAPDGQPIVPQIRPIRPRAIPAGAVLVAAQNTALSTRTDENGQFSLGGLPAGQYFTIAAGPVSSAANASAARVNVQVSAGQTVDLGTLSLAPTNGVGCVFGGGPLPMAPSGAVTGAPAQDSGPGAPPAPDGATDQP